MTQPQQIEEHLLTGSFTLQQTGMDTIVNASVGAVLVQVLDESIGATLPGARRVEGTAGIEYLAPERSEIVLSTTKVCTIGRGKANSLILDIPDISRAHAQIQFTGGRWLLSDCGSLNGTFLNEERLASHGERTLTPGDKIRLGTIGVYMLQIRLASRETEGMSRT